MGRIGRVEYIISLIVFFVLASLIDRSWNSSVQSFAQLTLDLFFFSQAARRFHDFGKSGGWVLVPIISWIWAIFPESIEQEDATA